MTSLGLSLPVGAMGTSAQRTGHAQEGKPLQASVSSGLRGGGQLTLGKAVPRVDVPVVDVHDVHTLVAHEVPLMPVALGGEPGSRWRADALREARPAPPRAAPEPEWRVRPCGSHGQVGTTAEPGPPPASVTLGKPSCFFSRKQRESCPAQAVAALLAQGRAPVRSRPRTEPDEVGRAFGRAPAARPAPAPPPATDQRSQTGSPGLRPCAAPGQ